MVFVTDTRSIPASEQIRQIVVDSIKELNVTFTDLIYYKEINKFSGPKIAIFRAQLIGFYTFLRPKIMGYAQQLIAKDKDNPLGKDYAELLNYMDNRVNFPSRFNLEEMKEVFQYLMQFCEDYDLTRTTIKHVTSEDLE